MSVLSETSGLGNLAPGRFARRPRRSAASYATAASLSAPAPAPAHVSAAPAHVSATPTALDGAPSVSRWPRRLGWAMTVAGAGMIPWLVVLAITLPARASAGNWTTVWVGLDSMEALGLAATGFLLRRRDARASLTAAATAVLLVTDAWFDVLTSAPGADRMVAVLMAACAEVPLAALCAFLAVRLFPRQAFTAAFAAPPAAAVRPEPSEH